MLTGADCAETFPAASYALTVYDSGMAPPKPVSEWSEVVVVPTWLPFRKT